MIIVAATADYAGFLSIVQVTGRRFGVFYYEQSSTEFIVYAHLSDTVWAKVIITSALPGTFATDFPDAIALAGDLTFQM
jgi:hypothetical protein